MECLGRAEQNLEVLLKLLAKVDIKSKRGAGVMTKESVRQKRVVWGLVFVAAAGFLAVVLSVSTLPTTRRIVATHSGQRNAFLQQPDKVLQLPDFTLIERSGKKVALGDLRGKVWIADFIWTRCPDACPLMSGLMARLQTEFANEPDLRLVSFSVDPQYDTPAVLASYAAKYGADPDRWLFLTGEKETIYRLIREGFKLLVLDPGDVKAFRNPPTPSSLARQVARSVLQRWLRPAVAWAHAAPGHRENPVIHSDRFVLVDRAGWIRGTYSSSDTQGLARLKQDARLLLPARDT